MSKRLMSKNSQNELSKPKKHWSMGLVESMKDADLIYKDSDRIVVIRDKYPKAKIHFLVLPKENITSIYKLTTKDVALLQEFGEILKMIQIEHKNHHLNAGFHAVPSMQRLHMHIISKDMVSPCLKTKVHWNSFTTALFKPYNDVLEELKKYGSIKEVANEEYKTLKSAPLKCNQCSYVPKNIPQLKEHLLTHL
ncbi:PREDICTED: aprataxin [Papilio polytes]|uniref:aprataxin n=1 Tax=Papilio polytes TaxID=76194 RepID=UPI00067609C0|nr:PREDICTED: aprataxin [Papilio polytes]